jgi:hypothetical protein
MKIVTLLPTILLCLALSKPASAETVCGKLQFDEGQISLNDGSGLLYSIDPESTKMDGTLREFNPANFRAMRGSCLCFEGKVRIGTGALFKEISGIRIPTVEQALACNDPDDSTALCPDLSRRTVSADDKACGMLGCAKNADETYSPLKVCPVASANMESTSGSRALESAYEHPVDAEPAQFSAE